MLLYKGISNLESKTYKHGNGLDPNKLIPTDGVTKNQFDVRHYAASKSTIKF